MADGSQRRTQVERRDEAERRMLEAGARLVAERGLDRLTLAEVGTAAGYSRGLPAHHFGSKEKFRAALFRFVVDEYKSRIEVYNREPGLAALIEMLSTFLVLATQDSIYLCATQIVLSDELVKSEISSEIQSLRQEQVEGIESQIRQGIKKGEIRHNVDPRSASIVLIASACGVLNLALADRTIDIKAAIQELIDLILGGLEAHPVR